MHERMLGGTGPRTSAIGLGCLPFTGGYGHTDVPGLCATVDRAIEVGITLVDTADFYAGGDVERFLSAALAGRRNKVLLATRGGAVFSGGARPTEFDGRPEFLRRAGEASLRRLHTDHIDLYLLARPDPSVPLAESVGGLGELVEAGLVRYVGLSEVSAAQLAEARAVYPIAAVESEYSLWERRAADDVLPEARRLGVGFIAHSPLGRGFLTGTVTRTAPGDYRARQERFAPDHLAAANARLAALAPIAERLRATYAQLALAWLLATDPNIVAIPGSRHPGHVAENAAAADLRLDPEDLAAVDAVLAVEGARA